MLSSAITTQKPGSGSDWLPDANNLDNFIAKLYLFTEDWQKKIAG